MKSAGRLMASAALLGWSFVLIGGSPARAKDDVESFFHGKQIHLFVGSAAGSGYDIMARAVAQHMSDHIPGHPVIIVENQPGAASVVMTNSLVANQPHDGTAFGAAINGMPTAQLLSPGSVHFDPTKLIWLGSADRDSQVAYVSKTSPVQSLQDLETKELIVGATTPGTTQVDFPVIAKAFLGLKFKVVSGYEGTAQIHKAVEAGEVQGVGANAFASLQAVSPHWLPDGFAKVIGLWNPTPSPSVGKDVPLFISLAKTEKAREALMLMVSRVEYGRPFFAPPGVPADRAKALKTAFMETMKDPAFLADAQKLHLEIDPISGEQVEKLVKEAAATPPDVVAAARAALAQH
jgi:tripartite-type tricarboxylate transporter receptor subunit TctC